MLYPIEKEIILARIKIHKQKIKNLLKQLNEDEDKRVDLKRLTVPSL